MARHLYSEIMMAEWIPEVSAWIQRFKVTNEASELARK